MDDKFKRDLVQELTKELTKTFNQIFEEKFIKLFNQGVDEVLIPQFEEIDKEMKAGFNQVNNRIDNLAKKMDLIAGKQIDDEYQIKNHEKRITKLESHRAVV